MKDNSSTLAVPLTQLGLIEARGADAAAFLQGQLSNDVRKVAPEQAQLSSYNSPKGRMLAVLHLLRRDDAFLLELHADLLAAVLKRLKMYVLRSQVTLTAVADRALLGLAGPQAAKALADAGLPAPAAPLVCAWAGDTAVVRRLGATPRFTILVPIARREALWGQLTADAHAGTPEDWRRLDIEAGLPTVYPETQDRFVAQMCNLDALGGISFDKGCYTGQEIIARVHYRGAVKRHMEMRRLDGPPPVPGTRLESGGEVVDAAPAAGDAGSLALVVTGP
jgi:tRNA-modifying protein YgfZ